MLQGTSKMPVHFLLYMDILNMKLVLQELKVLYRLINVQCVFYVLARACI